MPSKTYYFNLRQGSDLLNNGTTPEKIALAIKGAIGGVYTAENIQAQFFEALEKAKRACGISSDRGGIVGIAELNLTHLPTEAEPNVDYAAALIKVHHIRGFEVSPEDIDAELHEKKHLKHLQEDFGDDSKLEMDGLPRELLQRLPKELYYLLFVDYQLFHHLRETWVQYEKRQLGCIKNLFDAIRLNVLPYFDTPEATKSQISLKHIQQMHSTLSQKLPNKTLTPGEIRTEFNAFPINTSSASVAGITELLLRIKNDNNQNGFMISDMKRTYLVNKFMRELREQAYEEQYKYEDGDLDNLPRSESLAALKSKSITHVFDEIKKDFPTITLEQISAVIQSAWSATEIEKKIKEGSKWRDVAELLYGVANQALNAPIKDEYQLEMKLARSTPLAAAGSLNPNNVNLANMTNQQIENLAIEIFNMLEKTPTISIFSPEPQLAVDWAQKAIREFNEQIPTAKYTAQKIDLIDRLTHEIEILHLFLDVNCRTAYLIMNQLLLNNGIMWSILYNPNRMDAYSAKERQHEIKTGIQRFQYLCNRPSFVDYNHVLLASSGPVSNQDFTDSDIAERRKAFFENAREYYARLSEDLVLALAAKQESAPRP